MSADRTHSRPITFVIITVWLHFADVTGYVVKAEETRITCWTCPNMDSNEACNDWAPDIYCPMNKIVCQTVHSFSAATGASLQVRKMCVLPMDCTHDHVGCHVIGNSNVCTSCCNVSYCNKEVPQNNITAIRLSVTVLGSSSLRNIPFHWTVLIMGAICTVLAAR